MCTSSASLPCLQSRLLQCPGPWPTPWNSSLFDIRALGFDFQGRQQCKHLQTKPGMATNKNQKISKSWACLFHSNHTEGSRNKYLFPTSKKKQLTVQKIRYPWYNLHFVEALWACFCSQAILLHQVPTTRKHAVLKLVGVKTHKCSCHQFYSFLQYSK